MPQELASALAAAFDRAEPEDRISAIKVAVSRQLEQTDQGARIRHTEYFNNSIAPDLVLQWPKEARERLVFLRPNPAPEWFSDDLDWISPSRPLVITLRNSSGSASPVETLRQIQGVAAETDTLIADPGAVEELGERNETEPTAGLLAQAVLRGGRGLLNEEGARSAVSRTIDGFHGAEHVNIDATQKATQLLTTLLQPEQASRLNRVLQSVWEGHGGRVADFPGPRSLSGRMTDQDLNFLIENVPTRSHDFWRRIGRGIDAAQIARLGIEENSPNLQAIISANADILLARGLRLVHESARLDETQELDQPRWLVSRGCLVLRGPDWAAYIAPNSVAELPLGDKYDGPSVIELRSRADQCHARIANLELDAGNRVIAYSSKEGEDVMHDDRLTQFTDPQAVRVHRATLALPNGGRLVCDFVGLTATGHTSAVFSIGDIVAAAIPILMQPDEVVTHFLDGLTQSLRSRASFEQQMLDFEV